MSLFISLIIVYRSNLTNLKTSNNYKQLILQTLHVYEQQIEDFINGSELSLLQQQPNQQTDPPVLPEKKTTKRKRKQNKGNL